jgi:L-threonylcarbamoyladenylate synthase
MYGLVGAVPDSEERIRSIKGRGDEKPFLQLLPDSSWVAKYSPLSTPANLRKYWPGPLTLVFPTHEGGTVAFRVPDSRFLQRLLQCVSGPLYSTSVNRAGAAPLRTVQEMRREFEGDVDLIYDAGDISPGPPSTLVDLSSRPYKVLREGALVLTPADLS